MRYEDVVERGREFFAAGAMQSEALVSTLLEATDKDNLKKARLERQRAAVHRGLEVLDACALHLSSRAT